MKAIFKFIQRPKYIAKGIILLAPLGVLFGLINDHLILTPTVTYAYVAGKPMRAIGPSAATKNGISVDLNVPRVIAGVRLRGRINPGNDPVIWFKAEGAKEIDLRTLVYSSVLDHLSWNHVTNGSLTLWMRSQHQTTETVAEGKGKNQKETQKTWTKDIRQYGSVKDFFADPPPAETIGVAGVDRFALAHIDDSNLRAGSIVLPQTFRGKHQFYVYSDGRDLRIAFDKIDRNRKKDADPVTVRIVQTSQISPRHPKWLKTVQVNDDGNTGNSGPKGKAQAVEIILPHAPAGAYFVQIDASEDVVLKNLSSSTSVIAFTGRIFLAEGPAYGEKKFQGLDVVATASKLSFAAVHEQGKQDIFIRDKKYSLKEVNDEVETKQIKGVFSFQIQRPDIKITTNGLLTISPAKVFPNSGSVPLELQSPIELNDLDYVIAEYKPHTSQDVSFDEKFSWNELDVRGKTLRFQFELPGIKDAPPTMTVESIRATLFRGPFPWKKIWEKTSNGLST